MPSNYKQRCFDEKSAVDLHVLVPQSGEYTGKLLWWSTSFARADLGGGCRGVHPPPPKKKEQETSAPSPK